MSGFFAIFLTLLAIFLILLVLVQRGRGGGLAGALGGMGGSSAFGAKAGDVFTRITIITAAIWIGISLIVFFWADHRGDALGRESGALNSPAADAATDVFPQPKPDTEGGGPALRPAEKAEEEPAATPPANTTPPTNTDSAPPAESK